MIHRFIACRAGSVAVSTIFVLTLLIGLTGLGVEVSRWYQIKRQMQGAADAAAVSAAWDLTTAGSCSGGSSCTWAPGLQGLAVAAENGWQYSSTNGVQIQVVSPPTLKTSPFYNNPSAVEVWITQPQVSLFGSVATNLGTTVGAYAIAAATTVVNSTGTTCILALANAANAIQVRGTNANIQANCGLAVDGGRSQNAPGTGGQILGGLQFQGGATVHITTLTVAASSTSCPDATRCFLYNSTAPLPAANVFTNTASNDPYKSRIFTVPGGAAGVVVTGVTIVNGGTGYTNGTQTFTVSGGTGTSAQFTTTVSGGQLTSTGLTITDPGAYTAAPTGTISVTGGGGSGAIIALTTGSCASSPSTTPIPNRAYCVIDTNTIAPTNVGGQKTINFPTGIYYIEGGYDPNDTSCAGLCLQTGNIAITSDTAGVTFVLTHGSGAQASTYATFAISGNNQISLTAPTTNINGDGSLCSGSCANTTSGLIIFQDRGATPTTSLDSGGVVTPANTQNSFAGAGSKGTRSLSGTLYTPQQTITVTGNGPVTGACFGVVAKYLDDGGTPTFTNGCLPGFGGGSTSVTKTTLSE